MSMRTMGRKMCGLRLVGEQLACAWGSAPCALSRAVNVRELAHGSRPASVEVTALCAIEVRGAVTGAADKETCTNRAQVNPHAVHP